MISSTGAYVAVFGGSVQVPCITGSRFEFHSSWTSFGLFGISRRWPARLALSLALITAFLASVWNSEIFPRVEGCLAFREVELQVAAFAGKSTFDVVFRIADFWLWLLMKNGTRIFRRHGCSQKRGLVRWSVEVSLFLDLGARHDIVTTRLLAQMCGEGTHSRSRLLAEMSLLGKALTNRLPCIFKICVIMVSNVLDQVPNLDRNLPVNCVTNLSISFGTIAYFWVQCCKQIL